MLIVNGLTSLRGKGTARPGDRVAGQKSGPDRYMPAGRAHGTPGGQDQTAPSLMLAAVCRRRNGGRQFWRDAPGSNPAGQRRCGRTLPENRCCRSCSCRCSCCRRRTLPVWPRKTADAVVAWVQCRGGCPISKKIDRCAAYAAQQKKSAGAARLIKKQQSGP